MKKPSFFMAIAMIAGTALLPIAAQASPQPVIGQIIAGNGRPNRLTIINAFSCPFCKAYDRKTTPVNYLDWQRRGYEVEIISVVAFPSDRYSNALVQCNGMKGYLDRMRRLFEAQSMIALAPADDQKKQAIELAVAMKIPTAIALECLSPTGLKREDARTQRAQKLYKYGGTPSSYINGKFVGNGFEQTNEAIQAGRR